MQQITEEEYAMKFCMLIILDAREGSGVDRYTENFKYIVESYRKIIKGHPGLVMQESEPDPGSEEYRGQVRALTELCRARNINPILRQGNLDQSVLFSILVEAIYRTMILVRSYAPDGELIAEVLKETYCSGKDLSEVQLYRALNISRATYYRRKQKGIQYAGYFFYEAVLPDMEGLI